MKAMKVILTSALFVLLTANMGAQTAVTLSSVDGKELRALVTGAHGDSVVLQREDKRSFTVPMSRFDIDSQRIITREVLKGYESIPIPEMRSVFFRPRIEDQERIEGQVFLVTARSGDYWWPRLHVGDFSDKPAEFSSVVFRKGDSQEISIPVPDHSDYTGSIRGGKSWSAVEFSIDQEALRELAEVTADPRTLTGYGITKEGREEAFEASQLESFGSSIAIFLRAKAFASDPDFFGRTTRRHHS